jgi:gamma-glutamyltranspeptidase / glutathione hydrolase
MRSKSLLFFVLVFFLTACKTDSTAIYEIDKTAFSRSGVVVSAHPLATEAGLEILKAGGNAVDASIAVQFALAVVYPRAGNIGGGGFMVYRAHDGSTSTLDFREKAPAAATRNMYLDEEGNVIPDLSAKGHLAIGVPGTVAGLQEAHKKYGKMPFADLIAPAIKYAEGGYFLTEIEAGRLNKYRSDIEAYNDTSCPFVSASEDEWEMGERIVQRDLAATLRRIADHGEDGFYKGETADKIIAEVRSGDGILSLDDLGKYEAIWRDPISTEYKEYTLIAMPPPSSGGVALAQLLEMVEPYPIAGWGFQDSRTMHLMVEAERRVFADRAQYLGDPDFFGVPVDTLLDPEYLRYRMADFDAKVATASAKVGAVTFAQAMESFETTHLSVVDSEGNAVSVTTTLNSNYGSKVMVDGAGFFLNNEMDDFSVKPGIPNQFGLTGGEANAIESEKRMLSSMTPTIIEKNGEFYMTIGTPGGATIITSVFQVFLNVTEFGMTASEAVRAKRFHHQWLPDEIKIEKGSISQERLDALLARGHNLREVNSIGMVEAILLLPDGIYEGAADTRGDDHAAGM